jgi:lysophospholipase
MLTPEYREVTMKYKYLNDTIQSGGKKLHLDIYTAGGSEQVILFIPGMGCYTGIYADFLKGLAGYDFTVIGIDLPGHGRSEGPRGRFSFGDVIEAVSNLITYAGSRFNDQIGLMGTSLGGTYALYAAMSEIRLKAVLCHDAMDISSDLHLPARFPGIMRLMIPYMKFTARLFPGLPISLRILVDWHKVVEDPDLLNSLINDPHMVWTYTLGTWASFLNYVPNADLSEICIPVKIVVGSEDRIFTPQYCLSLSRMIGKDGACFEVIPGGHALTLECIPSFVPIAALWFREKMSNQERFNSKNDYLAPH